MSQLANVIITTGGAISTAISAGGIRDCGGKTSAVVFQWLAYLLFFLSGWQFTYWTVKMWPAFYHVAPIVDH